MTSDLMISMQTSDELVANKQVKLAVIKNRFGEFKQSFLCDINYPEMRISDAGADTFAMSPDPQQVRQKPVFLGRG